MRLDHHEPVGLAYLLPSVLAAQSVALAGSGRLEESVDLAGRAVELLRREGDIVNELDLLIPYDDALTALGRTREAAEIWRRFLILATSPELVQDTSEMPRMVTNGAEIIDRVKAKLAAIAR